MSEQPIYPRVGVACLLTSPDYPKSVLVGIRKGSHGAGKLAPPGGHVEMNEEWATTASREVAEETGLTIAEPAFHHIGTTNDPYIDARVDKHYITLFMYARLEAGQAAEVQLLEPNKCEGWKWMQWDNLIELAESAPEKLFDPLLRFSKSDDGRRFVQLMNEEDECIIM